jgi:sec-independent protein translocase protein TatA
MFDIGGSEAVIIILAVLLLFGAKRIPDLAKSMGSGIREFRRAMNEIQHEVQTATSLEPAPPARPQAPVLPPPENSLPAAAAAAAPPPAADPTLPAPGIPAPAAPANPAPPPETAT